MSIFSGLGAFTLWITPNQAENPLQIGHFLDGFAPLFDVFLTFTGSVATKPMKTHGFSQDHERFASFVGIYS